MSTTQLTSATTDARKEFLENLRQMATGSYLREEDREFWEAPYPESAVDEAQGIVDDMLRAAAFADAGTQPENPAAQGEAEDEDDQPNATTLAIAGVVTQHVAQLKQLSDRHEGALLEDEEIADLLALVERLAVELDADEIFVANQAEAVCED